MGVTRLKIIIELQKRSFTSTFLMTKIEYIEEKVFNKIVNLNQKQW